MHLATQTGSLVERGGVMLVYPYSFIVICTIADSSSTLSCSVVALCFRHIFRGRGVVCPAEKKETRCFFLGMLFFPQHLAALLSVFLLASLPFIDLRWCHHAPSAAGAAAFFAFSCAFFFSLSGKEAVLRRRGRGRGSNGK
jgi:hypothetical protein